MQMGAEIMTLEMRDREKRKEGEIYALLMCVEKTIFQKNAL